MWTDRAAVESSMEAPWKLKRALAHGPAIPLLGTYSEQTKIQCIFLKHRSAIAVLPLYYLPFADQAGTCQSTSAAWGDFCFFLCWSKLYLHFKDQLPCHFPWNLSRLIYQGRTRHTCSLLHNQLPRDKRLLLRPTAVPRWKHPVMSAETTSNCSPKNIPWVFLSCSILYLLLELSI